MKTVEELYKEITGSQKLSEEFKSIKSREELDAFLKKHGCGATAEEYADYVKPMYEGEIEDDEAEGAAGGLLPPVRPQPISGLIP